MNVKPCGDKLFVKIPKDEEITPAGILIPKAEFTKHVFAEVLAVSGGFYVDAGVFIPSQYEPGDVVVFHKGAAIPLEVEGEKFAMIREVDVHMRKLRKGEQEDAKS